MFTRLKLKLFPNLIIKKLSKKLNRRAFFVGEYRQMVERMWRGEFVREKKKEIREDMRREHDKIKEDLEALKIGLEKYNTTPDQDKTVKENYEKGIESKTKDIKQIEEQIDTLDKEQQELNQLLDGYRDGLELLKSIINE